MIAERGSNTVTSTVVGHDVMMSIDQGALAHIMNVLTDLYEDPEQANIREYATNALDSHVEAGQTRPIEVGLPTDLRPLYTVRDFGVGLSRADIENIYSRYGASTKRNTNDAVGMLGLGCKSALAYVDQFTLVGIKDGQRIAVSISRDENGAGVMTVLEQGVSDEPTGVEVIIPARRHNSLADKAARFFQYWEPGTVLVNGTEPAPLQGWKIDDEFMVVDKPENARKLCVVMGNVPYPISWEYEYQSAALRALPDGKQIVARVPIGMVTFTPSREALQDHPATTAALDQILATFKDACAHAIRSTIAGATSRPDASRALIAARDALGADNVPAALYNGEAIPTVLSAEDLPAGCGLWMNRVSGNHRSASHRVPAKQVSLDDAASQPWILDFSNANWSRTMRAKFDRYMEAHGLSDEPGKQNIFITDAPEVPLPEWMGDNVSAVSWKDVRKWKDPRTVSEGGTGGVSYAGTYRVSQPGSCHFIEQYPAEDLPKSGRKLYYYVGSKDELNIVEQAARILPDDIYVAFIPSPRFRKFRRQFPHALSLTRCAEKEAQGWWRQRTRNEKLACKVGPRVQRQTREIFTAVDAHKINDPQVSRWAAIIKSWSTLRKPFYERSAFLTSKLAECDANETEYKRCKKALSGFPLANEIYVQYAEQYAEHIVLYVNAVKAAEKRKV